MTDESLRVESWLGVPDGSRIRISAIGSTVTELFTAHIFLLRSDGLEQEIPDHLIQPGPVDIPFRFPHSYSIALDLIFATDATAVVTAEVFAPNGEAIPPLFRKSVPGSGGTTLGVSFFVTTI
jgi:hypothetical protein